MRDVARRSGELIAAARRASPRPPPPGEILLEEFLKPMGMTQTALAGRMSVPLQRVNTLINGKRAVTADTALLLSEIFGTSPEFWMNLQAQRDLYTAQRRRDEKRPQHRPGSRTRRPRPRPARSASTNR